jgi:hypothetical protein
MRCIVACNFCTNADATTHLRANVAGVAGAACVIHGYQWWQYVRERVLPYNTRSAVAAGCGSVLTASMCPMPHSPYNAPSLFFSEPTLSSYRCCCYYCCCRCCHCCTAAALVLAAKRLSLKKFKCIKDFPTLVSELCGQHDAAVCCISIVVTSYYCILAAERTKN